MQKRAMKEERDKQKSRKGPVTRAAKERKRFRRWAARARSRQTTRANSAAVDELCHLAVQARLKELEKAGCIAPGVEEMYIDLRPVLAPALRQRGNSLLLEAVPDWTATLHVICVLVAAQEGEATPDTVANVEARCRSRMAGHRPSGGLEGQQAAAVYRGG